MKGRCSALPPAGPVLPSFLKGGPRGSRLGKLIAQLIHPDQTGSLLGRSPANGRRKLLIGHFWFLTGPWGDRECPSTRYGP